MSRSSCFISGVCSTNIIVHTNSIEKLSKKEAVAPHQNGIVSLTTTASMYIGENGIKAVLHRMDLQNLLFSHSHHLALLRAYTLHKFCDGAVSH